MLVCTQVSTAQQHLVFMELLQPPGGRSPTAQQRKAIATMHALIVANPVVVNPSSQFPTVLNPLLDLLLTKDRPAPVAFSIFAEPLPSVQSIKSLVSDAADVAATPQAATPMEMGLLRQCSMALPIGLPDWQASTLTEWLSVIERQLGILPGDDAVSSVLLAEGSLESALNDVVGIFAGECWCGRHQFR